MTPATNAAWPVADTTKASPTSTPTGLTARSPLNPQNTAKPSATNSTADTMMAANPMTRHFKVMGPSGNWHGAEVRLRGNWLVASGFHPGARLQLHVKEAGVMELRVVDAAQLTAKDFVVARDTLATAIAATDSRLKVTI